MEGHLRRPGRVMDFSISRDLNGLSREVATFVGEVLRRQGNQKPLLSVALAGGSTPKRLYETLATPPVGDGIPWDRIQFFWGDERCVPPTDPQSNFRMADEALLSKIPVPRKHIHRMRGEFDPPDRAAALYERELHDCFDPPSSGWPRFDLVLLGIGPDGHTASLFPGSSVLNEKERWVRSVCVDSLPSHRLTLTLPVINHAVQIVFLAAGREKAPVLKSLTDPETGPSLFPFQMVQPVRGRLKFFVDQESASLMDLSRLV